MLKHFRGIKFFGFLTYVKNQDPSKIHARVTISPYALTWCQKSRLPKQKLDSGNDFNMINVFNTSHGSFQILFWCFQNSLEEMWGHFLNNLQDVYKWEDELTPFLVQDLPKYQKCWCPHVSFSKTENVIGKWMKVFWKYSLSSRNCTERIEIRPRKCWDIFEESNFLVFS